MRGGEKGRERRDVPLAHRGRKRGGSGFFPGDVRKGRKMGDCGLLCGGSSKFRRSPRALSVRTHRNGRRSDVGATYTLSEMWALCERARRSATGHAHARCPTLGFPHPEKPSSARLAASLHVPHECTRVPSQIYQERAPNSAERPARAGSGGDACATCHHSRQPLTDE